MPVSVRNGDGFKTVNRGRSGMNFRKEALPEVLKFLISGAINAAFGYSVFALIFILTGAHRFAVVFATVIGIVFNYITTGRFVFERADWRAFPRFAFIYALLCVVNIGLLDMGRMMNVSPLFGQLLALCIIVPTTFVLLRSFVFRRHA